MARKSGMSCRQKEEWGLWKTLLLAVVSGIFVYATWYFTGDMNIVYMVSAVVIIVFIAIVYYMVELREKCR